MVEDLQEQDEPDMPFSVKDKPSLEADLSDKAKSNLNVFGAINPFLGRLLNRKRRKFYF